MGGRAIVGYETGQSKRDYGRKISRFRNNLKKSGFVVTETRISADIGGVTRPVRKCSHCGSLLTSEGLPKFSKFYFNHAVEFIW